MPERLNITITCLRLSALLFILAGLIFGSVLIQWQTRDPFFPGFQYGLLLLTFALLLAIGIELVVQGLRQLRYWAWIVALIICGLYVTSFLALLGFLGLWGLLVPETQAAFEQARRRR